MSRSGYCDDLNNWDLIKYRGQVASAIRGRRGQRFLQELREALDAMPDKRLIAHELQTPEGACCALGALALARGIDLVDTDAEDATESGELAGMFDVANQLIREVQFMNDETLYRAVGEDGERARWRNMSAWVDSQLKKGKQAHGTSGRRGATD